MTSSPERDPLDSTSPDFDFAWQGYCEFWRQAVDGAIPWRQVERFALDWGLPPGLKPIMGGDIFSDIAGMARDFANVVSRIVNTIGDAVWNVVWVLPRFLSDFWNRLSYVGDYLGDRLRWLVETAWNGLKWVAETLQNRLSYIGDYIGDRLWWLVTTVWDGLSWVATNIWNGVVWAANRVWDGISWAGATLYNGVVWAGQKGYDGVVWAANRVWDGLSYVGGKAWDGATWVATKVWDGLSWAGTHLYDGITWLGGQLWERITWATSTVWEFGKPFVTWLQDNILSEPLSWAGSARDTFRIMWDPTSPKNPATFGQVIAGAPQLPILRTVFWMLALLSLLITVPQQLSTIYTMRMHQEAAASAEATLLSQTQIREMTRRGIDFGEGAVRELRLYGFSPNKVQGLMELYNELATPTDLIRMGVREVFTPEVAEAFGQFEDFPPEFGRWMGVLGFSDFWAKAYWAAHWDLPSPQQGFEMYHRDIIDRPKLELLLRALDVMPFWRDQMIQIAYNPITRIDLRRMFRAGALTEAEVRRGYLDLGYAPVNADKIVEWVKREAAGVSKELPSGAILRAYRKRLLTRQDAAAALEDLELSPDAVDVLLDLEDLTLEEDRADLLEDITRKDYKAGSITRDQAGAQLAEIGVPQERVNLLLDLWTVETAPRTATLTAAELQRAFREGTLTEPYTRQRLKALGFNEADIDVKLALATPEPAPPDPPDLSLAQLQAATRRGFLSTFLNVREWLDDVIELEVATGEDIRALTDILRGRGYGEVDATILVALTFPAPDVPAPPKERTLTAAQVLRAFKGATIDAGEVIGRLRAMGYSERDIAILLVQNEPGGA